MRRAFYVFCAMVLGFLLQLLVHAGVEIFYINLLLSDFHGWSHGLSWEALWRIHNILSALLAVVGIWFGYWLGVPWWRVIYIEKRYWWRRR